MTDPLHLSWLWFRHTGEIEPADDWEDSKPGRGPTFRDTDIDERLQGQHTITHMIISDDDYISDHVLEKATKLTHLKVINSPSTSHLSQRLIRWFRRLTHLQSLSLRNESRCTIYLDLAVREDWSTGFEGLFELKLERYNLRKLPTMFGSLKQLRKLKLRHCEFSQLPSRVAEWGALTELKLEHCDFSKGLPPLVMSLSQLRTLKISFCQLKELPDRVAEWGGLTELELKFCDFSDGLPPLFMTLSQLRTLKIHDCKLKELPDSVKQLVCLKKIQGSFDNVAEWGGLTELELKSCHFSKGLPHQFMSLSQLRTLKISNCGLRELPNRVAEWGGLTELELEYCDFSKGLPPQFMSLSQLRTLKIYDCQLKELPDRVKQLVYLRDMDLSENRLETLPWSVLSLPCIERIDLTKNGKLKYLSSSKLEMSRLKKLPKLVLTECNFLRQPPLEICSQGPEAILSYYTAMGKEESCLLSLLTVGVLGESFSGKTSVVKSLKKGRRILTQRSKTSRKDETTVVFNHETIDIHGGKTDIRFIDLGGNGVYHPTYKLALKSSFIPALVVNIKRYMDLSIKSGHEEATKRLCFDWMAHFYLANKNLGRPFLILTHKDELNADQEQQKKMANRYKDILLETVAQLQRVANMMVFEDDRSNSIFEDVFIVGNDDSFDEFKRLLLCIENRTYAHLYEFPDAWKAMMKTIEDSEEPFLEIEYLKGVFSDSKSLFVMLRFMHRSGRILWLEDLNVDTSNKIFHNIQRVTRTIAILFNHNDLEKWEQRKLEYLAESDEARGDRVWDAEFPAMIFRYLKTGMIDERLLRSLISQESNIPVEDALTLMKSFLLIYGPIQEKEDIYYAVPYFSTTYTNNQWRADGSIQLRLSLGLNCLYALPQHAYHQISLLLARLECNQKSSLEFKRNGATIYHEGWKTHFIHDHNNSKATLQASTSVEKLTESWTTLRSSVTAILHFLNREWEAVRPLFILYCGSCLLTDQLKPDERIISFDTSSDEPAGDKTVHCEEEDCQVPASLVKPCYSMTADDLESLRSYINQNLYKSTADGNPVAVPENPDSIGSPTQPTQQEEMWEVPRELDDLMKNSADPDIILTPHQTPEYLREKYFNTDQVYPMSGGKRGRALIISNKFSSCLRHGAEQDFINLERMFESFQFDVVGEHKDYTAQEIHDTIVRETEVRCHHLYGMFALVITSHGNDGLVDGTDDHSIKLCDIYGLLSATKFPAMEGKPKLVVIQACSGGRMDAPTELGGYRQRASMINKTPINVSTAHAAAAAHRAAQARGGRSRNTVRLNSSQTSGGAGHISSHHSEPNLSMDHLMIIKASLTGFGSMRHPTNGSWLIRAFVLAFYKHGHWIHLEELCVMAKDQVRLMSIANSEEKREARGQIPDLTCTFTNGRSVYLFPGYHG